MNLNTLKILIALAFFSFCCYGQTGSNGRPRFFSIPAWESAKSRLNILNTHSRYPVKVNFSVLEVNPFGFSIEEKSLGKPLSFSEIARKIQSNDLSAQDLEDAHGLAIALPWFKNPSQSNVVVQISIGTYFNSELRESTAGYKIDFNGGSQVPPEIIDQLRAYDPSTKFNFAAGDAKSNDAAFEEFISFLTRILHPALNNYLYVNGKKFYSGEVAYIPVTNSYCVNISAFHHNGTKFSNKHTRWAKSDSRNDPPVLLDPQSKDETSAVNFCQQEPSETLYGSLITATEPDGATVSVHVVKVLVSYEKHADDRYGFDGNKIWNYPTYNTRPMPGMPWKSIPASNESVPVNFTVTPAEATRLISFSIGDDVNFRINSVSGGTLYISGSKHKSETSILPVMGDIKCEYQKLNVVAFDMKTQYMTLIQLHEGNDDEQLVEPEGTTPSAETAVVGWGNNKFVDTKPEGDDVMITRSYGGFIAAGKNKRCDTKANNTNTLTTGVWGNSIRNFDVSLLENYLNRMYNPALVQFKIVNTYDKVINYDFNRNGYFDFSFAPIKGEEDLAIVASLAETPVSNRHSVQFIGRLSADAPLGGFAGIGEQYSLIRTFNEDYFEYNNGEAEQLFMPFSTYALLYMTSAHEIGHAVFGLRHPVDEFHEYSKKSDAVNLMEWGRVIDRALRKYQWDIIQKE